ALATTSTCTLSLHDALPISGDQRFQADAQLAELHVELVQFLLDRRVRAAQALHIGSQRLDLLGRLADLGAESFQLLSGGCLLGRSEEHTSELQSRENLVCRL